MQQTIGELWSNILGSRHCVDPLELTCEILLRLVLYCAITSGTRSGQVIPRAKVMCGWKGADTEVGWQLWPTRSLSPRIYAKILMFCGRHPSCLDLAWSGMMQFVHLGDHPGKETVYYEFQWQHMHILMFVSEHARRHEVTHPNHHIWSTLLVEGSHTPNPYRAWMHRTPDGVIWSARVDLCSQRSGPYVASCCTEA